MKNFSRILILFLFIGIATNISAQNKQKFGHINSDKLLQMMPGIDSVQMKLEKYRTSLEKQLQSMQAEYETKLSNYMAEEATMSELVKQTKAKEINDLEGRIQAFQNSAQETYMKEQEKLLTPIIEKAQKAIDEVAEENGYSYIFDAIPTGTLLYTSDKDNIMPLVKKKLGIE